MKHILIFFSVLSIWLSAASANDYPYTQKFPQPLAIIEQITVHYYDAIGGYRLDFYCSDNSHYIYISHIGAKYSTRIEKRLMESIGQPFRVLAFVYLDFDLDIIPGEEWHKIT